MDLIMSLRKLVVTLFLGMVLLGCSASADWNGDPQLVHKLQLKMTEADVKAVLGEPSEVSEQEIFGQQMIVWQYYGTERVGVVFQNGKLVATNLGVRSVLQAGINDL
jgi:hypothetical protein